LKSTASKRFLQGFAPHLQGAFFAGLCPAPARERFAGLCPAPARKLFEKSFLDLQKLLKMGIIKPRPSGEVAAVGLTERASLQGSALHPQGALRGSASRTARELFEKFP